MTNEERDRAMDFIVENLARLTVNDQRQDARLDKMIQSHDKAIDRLDRFERIMKMMIRAGRRERRTRGEGDKRLESALAKLADSQAHSESRLDALIDIVRRRTNGE